jgi:hypothetical protein
LNSIGVPISVSKTPGAAPRRPRWPWVALGLALAWSALVRVPLILNAATHLDSDLAVDGLTLLEAVHGHWRWHYPGTPYTGTFPVLLSLPQALLWGATPITLVSGGIVAHGLLTLAVFLLAWRAYGPRVAGWSLVPLAFASTGTLWLSGRITGGHLLTAAWHAWAFALLYEALARGGWARTSALGLWSGLGLYLDAMFAVSLAGLVPAAVIGWWSAGGSGRVVRSGLVFLIAFLAGVWPREVGRRIELHDAYREQFRPMLDRGVLLDHARILGLECLPRLIVGHRLPGLEADPDPQGLAGPGPSSNRPDDHPAAAVVTLVGLALCLASIVALAATRPTGAGGAVRWGLLMSGAAVAVGFVLNEKIFNSDNYRYLVTLLVPWALGFGLAMDGLSRRGRGGLAAAGLCGLALSGLMSFDSARWYARFGWIDAAGRPIRVPIDDPTLSWLDTHRDVRAVYGDYWDVYRLSFLSGGRVRGVPFPTFPDRFPEWSRNLPGGRPDILIARRTRDGTEFYRRAMGSGGRVLYLSRGIAIVSWPGA